MKVLTLALSLFLAAPVQAQHWGCQQAQWAAAEAAWELRALREEMEYQRRAQAQAEAARQQEAYRQYLLQRGGYYQGSTWVSTYQRRPDGSFVWESSSSEPETILNPYVEQ